MGTAATAHYNYKHLLLMTFCGLQTHCEYANKLVFMLQMYTIL